jgi:integrase
LLGAIVSYAVDHHMRADNPAHRVRKYAENKRERRLSDAEYAALGDRFRRAEGTIWPRAIACARFLALTGWRSGEALALRWRDIDLVRRTATLPDTKTGRSMRPLPHTACDVLRGLGRGADEALVVPATRGAGPMVGFKKMLRRLAAALGLPADVTSHVLRHSFASLAADLGYSEPTIAALSARVALSRPAMSTAPTPFCSPRPTRWQTRRRGAWGKRRPRPMLSSRGGRDEWVAARQQDASQALEGNPGPQTWYAP